MEDGHFIDDPLMVVNVKPDFEGLGMEPEKQHPNKYEDVRLSEQELTDMSLLFKGVWEVEEDAQCINIDGPVYVSDILKAADFIRSKKYRKRMD